MNLETCLLRRAAREYVRTETRKSLVLQGLRTDALGTKNFMLLFLWFP